MIPSEMAAAIITVRQTTQLDYLQQLLWKQHAAGKMNDDDAQGLAEALANRRIVLTSNNHKKPSAPLLSPPRPAVRSSNRRQSIERRRRQAASGFVPPTIAANFTTGEVAVLTVVATFAKANKGVCDECIAKICAFAGVSRTTAQSAIRQARLLGLIKVVERKRHLMPNLTNVITIVDMLWQSWLNRRAGGDRVKFLEHDQYKNLNNQVILKNESRSQKGLGLAYTYPRQRPD